MNCQSSSQPPPDPSQALTHEYSRTNDPHRTELTSSGIVGFALALFLPNHSRMTPQFRMWGSLFAASFRPVPRILMLWPVGLHSGDVRHGLPQEQEGKLSLAKSFSPCEVKQCLLAWPKTRLQLVARIHSNLPRVSSSLTQSTSFWLYMLISSASHTVVWLLPLQMALKKQSSYYLIASLRPSTFVKTPLP